MTDEENASVLGPIGTLIEQAYSYAQLGLEVFPANPADKTPLVSQYKATTDLDTIEAWWKKWPDALIGHRIAPDQIVLDIDPRHGGDQTWAALLAEMPVLHTRTHFSGRGDGGHHVWLRRPGDHLTITAIDQWAKERGLGEEITDDEGRPTGRWVSGIDLLHHKHRYTILPPSHHPETGRPYHWGKGRGVSLDVAPPPQVLVDLLVRADVADVQTLADAGPRFVDPDSIADLYSQKTSWVDLLERHAWVLVGGDGNGDGSRWRHPTATSAVSATIKHRCLFVYSPNTPFEVTYPEDPHGYTPFRAMAELEHQGDLSAAGRAARKALSVPDTTLADSLTEEELEVEAEELPCANAKVDWAKLWARERQDHDWFVEPILAAGRSHAIYSLAKTGKSLLALEMAAARAVGASVLHQPAGDPTSVVYFDLEMTEEDLLERMEEYGYGPESVLERLHYYLLPDLPPLDTEAGGKVVEQIARHHRAAFVFIDTTARVVVGGENDADTYRALYANTGVRLKRQRIGQARLDHAGKDLEKGQRGSSGKNDDVDIVWQLGAQHGGGLRVRATHRRPGGWIPETVNLNRQTESRLHHVVIGDRWMIGTRELAAQLDELEIPVALGRGKVASLVRAQGVECSSDRLADAIKYRKEQQRTGLRTGFEDPTRSGGADSNGSNPLTWEDRSSGQVRTDNGSHGGQMPPPIGGQLSGAGPDDDAPECDFRAGLGCINDPCPNPNHRSQG